MHGFRLGFAFLILILVAGVNAQDVPATSPTTAPKTEDGTVTTEHTVTIDGERLAYTATAGKIELKDDAGKLRGSIFYVAYNRALDDPAAVRARPITFVFNGGPGAASVWLHLGTAGPMRVVLPDDGTPPPPPHSLAPNPHSWLDLTDLVFIDPVGTGFSRPADAERGKEFYGVDQDVASVGEFIRLYLTKYDRWTSPKFLAGESYGTTRAAGLSEHLHDRYGIDLNGIILISTVLNFQTFRPDDGNHLPYPLFLPTYTAAAWYHKKLPPELQKDLADSVKQSERFALTEYMPALMLGASMSDEQRRDIAEKLARFTGLSLDYIEQADLKVSPSRFQKALLADQRRSIGRMDARLTGHVADALNDTPEFDPSLSGYYGLFSTTFNDYVRRELKYETNEAYEFLSPRVRPWDYGPAGRGFLDVAPTLRRTMTKVPSMKVMLASGYYDLATPVAAADYTLNQLPLSDELRKNLTHTYYEGGHMMYLNEPSLVKLKKDLAGFYRSARAPVGD